MQPSVRNDFRNGRCPIVSMAIRSSGFGQEIMVKTVADETTKDFLYFSQNMGFHLWELDEKSRSFGLNISFNEDLHGRAQYKVKSFLLVNAALSVLRKPFQKQARKLSGAAGSRDLSLCSSAALLPAARWMKLQAQLYQKGDNLLIQVRRIFIRRFGLASPFAK